MGFDCSICLIDLEEPGQPTPPPRASAASSTSSESNDGAPPPSKKRRQKDSTSDNNEDYAICTPCGHLFHKSCISICFASSPKSAKGTILKCPPCGKVFSIKNLLKLYPDLSDDKKEIEAENLKLKEAIINQQLRITQVDSEKVSLIQAQTLDKDKITALELSLQEKTKSKETANVGLNGKINNLKLQQSSLAQDLENLLTKSYNQRKEEIEGAMNSIAIELRQLEAENTLVQVVTNLKPEAKMELSFNIEGWYTLISSVNFGEYMQAAGILIDQSSNSNPILGNLTYVNVKNFGGSQYYIGSGYYYGGGRTKFVSTGSLFYLGKIFKGELEGVSSDIVCKTLITKESETTLVQQQIHNGLIWVTEREFTPTQLKVTLSVPAGIEGRAEGRSSTLVFKKNIRVN